MKIDAKIEFCDSVAKELGKSFTTVSVDADYVTGNESDIYEWVTNELNDQFGRTFSDEDFIITNLDEIIEEINFDEFNDKVN